MKPSPAAYENVLKRFGLSASEAVFFDDQQRNVDAAINLGMRAFRTVGLGEVVDVLEAERLLAPNAVASIRRVGLTYTT